MGYESNLRNIQPVLRGNLLFCPWGSTSCTLSKILLLEQITRESGSFSYPAHYVPLERTWVLALNIIQCQIWNVVNQDSICHRNTYRCTGGVLLLHQNLEVKINAWSVRLLKRFAKYRLIAEDTHAIYFMLYTIGRAGRVQLVTIVAKLVGFVAFQSQRPNEWEVSTGVQTFFVSSTHGRIPAMR